jgi:hypothetical protein
MTIAVVGSSLPLDAFVELTDGFFNPGRIDDESRGSVRRG